MTTDNRPPAPRAGRVRTMQDDLLHDLQEAAPLPIVPPAVEQASQRPPDRPELPERQRRSLHLHGTLQRWSWPHVRVLPRGSGLSVQIGPLRVSCALDGR